MFLSYHGGGCCGVKHIWNFPADPKTTIAALNECSIGEQPYKRFFNKAAPSETALARLDRYIEHMHKAAPGNLIEIFLAEYKGNKPMCQVSHGWPAALEERGFVASEPFVNSNTNNLITRYTLVLVKGKSNVKQTSLRETIAAEPAQPAPAPVRRPRARRSPPQPMEA